MASNANDRIRPWDENPRYWQYKGEPVLLLGGTREDNLFQIPDLEAHLDLLASVGGNVIRNTMSDRDQGDVYPYLRLPDGRYDLDQWNEVYWHRFAEMLRLTAERDIVVQIEVWDRFDLSDVREMGNWQRHPYRPTNNVTYTGEETGLGDAYPDHPGADLHPFYHTIPGMAEYEPRYDRVRAYQERYVARLLSHSLPYGNVLYCMDNETSTDARWGQHWMAFTKVMAAQAGADVYVTDMFDSVWHPEDSEEFRVVLGSPQLYDFLDISQINSRNFGEAHWDRLQWIFSQPTARTRPVNHTKIYSAGQTGFGSGTPQDGIERFWRNLLAGSASSRFHRPTSGIGLNAMSQACIKAGRLVESMVPFWEIEPHMELLSDRVENGAYLACDRGRAYVLFMPHGGSVSVDLTGAPASLKMTWIAIGTGKPSRTISFTNIGVTRVVAPSSAPCVGVLIA